MVTIDLDLTLRVILYLVAIVCLLACICFFIKLIKVFGKINTILEKSEEGLVSSAEKLPSLVENADKAIANANEILEKTDEILAEESEKNPDFKEIWESQKAFLAKARTWTKMGDFTYIEKTGDVEAEQNFTASVKKISVPEPVNSAASEINASTAAPKNEDNQTK